MDETILPTLMSQEPVRVAAAGHYAYRRGWQTVRETPQDNLLVWITAGSMDVSIDGSLSRAGSGDLVLLPKGRPHRYTPSSQDWEWLWLHCDGPASDTWWTALADPEPIRPLGVDPEIHARFHELVTATTRSHIGLDQDAGVIVAGVSGGVNRLLTDSRAHSLLGLMLHRLGNPATTVQDDAGLSGLTAWILQNLADSITVDVLARRSGWSTAHLHRLIARRYGTTPMRLVTRLRMQHAVRLLADTSLTITEIAHLVGFPDPLHFSRRFRACNGRPPSALREPPGLAEPFHSVASTAP
jgi:AraC family transcriptional regulator of arabinose operon